MNRKEYRHFTHGKVIVDWGSLGVPRQGLSALLLGYCYQPAYRDESWQEKSIQGEPNVVTDTDAYIAFQQMLKEIPEYVKDCIRVERSEHNYFAAYGLFGWILYLLLKK